MNEDDMNEPRGDDAAFLEGEAGDAVRDAIRADPVPPLDELTRRRLVSRALDEHVVGAPRRGPWLLGAAAAAMAVLVGVTVVLANRGGDDAGTDRAGDAPAAEDEREAEAAPSVAEDQLEGSGGAADAGGGGLGDLGRFEDRATLLAAARDAARDAEFSDSPSSETLVGLASPCDAVLAAEEPDLSLLGLGRATYRSDMAVVLVGVRPDGERIVAAVVITDCEIFSEPL